MRQAAQGEQPKRHTHTRASSAFGAQPTAHTAAAICAPQGSIFVLENLRWHLEEEGKREVKEGKVVVETIRAEKSAVAAFQASLAKLGDVYVNDAFGTAHRAHASMVGMAGKMPCVAGLLVQKELEAFKQVLDPSKVQRPLTAIVGGAKISDKILVIENLIDQSDRVMCIGGMAYTFLKVGEGMPIGKSLFDKKGALSASLAVPHLLLPSVTWCQLLSPASPCSRLLSLALARRRARAEAAGEGQGQGLRARLPGRLALRAGVQE